MNHYFYRLIYKITVISLFWVGSLLLVGCSADMFSRKDKNSEKEMVIDYSSTSCETLYQLNNNVISNQTYWLQLMTCAQAVGSVEVQEQLSALPTGDNSWPVLFERSILLNQLKPSDSERKIVMVELSKQCSIMPIQICHLVSLWLDSQQNLLILSNERYRYQRLKEKNDTDVAQLQNELADLQIKLKRLTDIEHQFSSRNVLRPKNSEKNSKASDKDIFDPITEENINDKQNLQRQEGESQEEDSSTPQSDE